MAVITLQTLSNYWQAVSDWVTGANGTYVPKHALANAPLAANVTMQNAATATGVGTPLPTSGQSIAVIEIAGTFTATIEFDVQGPNGGWYARSAKTVGTGTFSTTATTAGLYVVDVRGCQAIRANITAYTSGSITAVGTAQTGSAPDDFMSLAGRNTTEIVFFNALAITDTGNHTSLTQQLITLTGRKSLLIYNTLNQQVTITLVIKSLTGLGFSVYNGTINSGATSQLTDTDIPVLRTPIQSAYATAACGIAPSGGSVSVLMEGVQQ